MRKFESETSLRLLIDQEVGEGRNLEYKNYTSKWTKADREKFVKTICGFANADGGTIVLGMKVNDMTKTPTQIIGSPKDDLDTWRDAITSCIGDSIEPKIFQNAYHINSVPLKDGSEITFIIEVAKSHWGPHMVKGTFYIRHIGVTQAMTWEEVRSAFLLSENSLEKGKEFRNRIISASTSLTYPKLLLLVVPFEHTRPGIRANLRAIENENVPFLLGKSNGHRFDIEGFRHWQDHFDNRRQTGKSRITFHRRGVLEIHQIQLADMGTGFTDPFSLQTLEKRLVFCFPQWLHLLKKMEIQPPFFILLSFLETSGRTLTEITAISADRNELMAEEVLITSYEEDPKVFLKNAFDDIAAGFGLSHSPSYDDAGNWVNKDAQ